MLIVKIHWEASNVPRPSISAYLMRISSSTSMSIPVARVGGRNCRSPACKACSQAGRRTSCPATHHSRNTHCCRWREEMNGRCHVEHRHGRVWVNRHLTGRVHSRNAECFGWTSGLCRSGHPRSGAKARSGFSGTVRLPAAASCRCVSRCRSHLGHPCQSRACGVRCL